MIYADNAATTKLDEEAFEAIRSFLIESYGNPSQPYTFGKQYKKHSRLRGKQLQTVLVRIQKKYFLPHAGQKVIIGQ